MLVDYSQSFQIVVGGGYPSGTRREAVYSDEKALTCSFVYHVDQDQWDTWGRFPDLFFMSKPFGLLSVGKGQLMCVGMNFGWRQGPGGQERVLDETNVFCLDDTLDCKWAKVPVSEHLSVSDAATWYDHENGKLFLNGGQVDYNFHNGYDGHRLSNATWCLDIRCQHRVAEQYTASGAFPRGNTTSKSLSWSQPMGHMNRVRMHHGFIGKNHASFVLLRLVDALQ